MAAAKLVGAVLLFTGGCATMGKDACLSADWSTIGFEDGARGFKAERIGRHSEACAEYGVAPDIIRYRQGRQQGLVEWCKPHNGYNIGAKGGRYNGICPTELEGPFLQAMDAGRQVFDLKQEVEAHTRHLNDLYRELEQVEQELKRAQDELATPGTGPQHRRELLGGIRLAEADREAQLSDIAKIEQSLAETRARLRHMEAGEIY